MLIQWAHTTFVHDIAVLINMTSKHFLLLQSIWHQTRVTFLWCITNCSHWNNCIWSQDLWELKLNLLVLLSMYAMFILWMTLHVTQDVSPITWILWWQIRFIGIWMCVSPCVSTPTLDQFCRRLLLFLSWLIFLKTF